MLSHVNNGEDEEKINFRFLNQNRTKKPRFEFRCGRAGSLDSRLAPLRRWRILFVSFSDFLFRPFARVRVFSGHRLRFCCPSAFAMLAKKI